MNMQNETLKAAGCCAATLVVRSMQPSEYKLRFTRPVSVEEARRLLGVTEKEWPLGTVSREVSGGAEHFEVVLQDVIGALKVTPYVGKPDFSDVRALRSRYGNIPKLAKIGLLLEALGLRCRGEIETPVPVPTLSGGEMVWDVVQQLIRWLPGSTSSCMGGEVMVNCAARHNGTLTLASTGGTLLTETEQRVLTEEAHAATATLSLEETWCGKAVATGLHIGGQEVAVRGVPRTAAQEAAREALVEAINAAENGVVATPDVAAPNRVLLRAKTCGTDGNNVPLDYTGDAPCDVRLSGEQLAGGNVLVLEGEHASATLRPAENTVSIIVDGVALANVTRSGGAAAAAAAINAKKYDVQYTEKVGNYKYERRTRVVARADEEDPYLLHVGVEDTGAACNGISLAVAGDGAECNTPAMSGGKDSSELSPAVNATLYLQAKSSSAWARTTNSTNCISPMYDGGNIGWPGMLSGATAAEFAKSLQGETAARMQTQIVCDVLSPTLLKMTVVVGKSSTQSNNTAEFANKMGLMFHGNIGNYFTLTDMQGNDSNVALHCSGGRDAVLADDATAAAGQIHLAAGQMQIGEEVFEEKDLTALDGASWAESIESRSARFSAAWDAEAGTLTLTARAAGAEGNVRIIPAPSLQGDEELSGGSADVVATERVAGGWVQQHWGWADHSPQPLRLFIGGRQIELREACVSKADTLAALSTAINAADCGVTASLLSDTALLLTADMVGEAGNVVSLDAGRGLIASGSHLGGGDAETAATAVLRFDSTLGWLFVGGRGAGFAIAGYDIFLPRFTSVEAVVAAINSGEAFCAGDAFEPPVVASIDPEHEGRVVLTARKPGLEGNAITLLARAIAAAGTSISAATLTGGEEGYATGWVESDNWTTFCSEPSGLRIAGIELRSWWNATPSDFAATITAAGLGVTAEAQEDGHITLQAVEAGESGNAITLTCTPGGGITPSGNTLAGGAEAVYTAQYAENLQPFGYAGGLMRLNTQERTDLVASAVGVYGRYNYVTPAGETLNQPRAIATYVPPGTLVSSNGDNEQSGLPEGWVPLLQLACGQWETIRGLGVPNGWQLNGSKRSMLTPVGNVEGWKKFWKAFAPTQRLADIANLQFGTATFEPVAASDAFHTEGGSGLADETADAVPANYRALTDGNIYVLTDGSFPASDKASENLNGLLWCRGVLRQWVWVTQAQPSAKVTLEDLCEMFSGTVKVDGKTYHAAALQVEAVFINRRRLRYQTGTNQSDNSTPEVPEQPGVSGDREELVFADYKAACDALYDSARTLYTDASATVSLRQASDLPDLRLFAGVNFDNAGEASPIREISFDLFTRHMNISSGSPERLHMSEWLERRRLGHSLSLKALGSALLGGGN